MANFWTNTAALAKDPGSGAPFATPTPISLRLAWRMLARWPVLLIHHATAARGVGPEGEPHPQKTFSWTCADPEGQ